MNLTNLEAFQSGDRTTKWLSYLRSWDFFKIMKDEELRNIKSFYVFNCTPYKRCDGGAAAIFITIHDLVYGIGHNCSFINILGFDQNGSGYKKDFVSVPMEISGLSHRLIKDLSIGGLVGAAISGCGTLFWWGLCYRRQGEIITPHVPRVGRREYKKVVCGHRMMVALSVSHKVYVWGNVVNNNAVYFEGERLAVDLAITEISCGLHHVAMLSKQGNVYTWGRGGEGQRGLSSYTFKDQYKVSRVLVKRCSNIECGPLSTFCLTQSLQVRAWGTDGQYRTLGTVTKIKPLNYLPPVPLPLPVIKFALVWSQGDSSRLVARAANGKVYKWNSTSSTEITAASSFLEVYPDWKATPRLIKLNALRPNVIERLVHLKADQSLVHMAHPFARPPINIIVPIHGRPYTKRQPVKKQEAEVVETYDSDEDTGCSCYYRCW